MKLLFVFALCGVVLGVAKASPGALVFSSISEKAELAVVERIQKWARGEGYADRICVDTDSRAPQRSSKHFESSAIQIAVALPSVFNGRFTVLISPTKLGSADDLKKVVVKFRHTFPECIEQEANTGAPAQRP